MGPKLNINDEFDNEVQTLAEQELQEKMSINSEPAKSAQVEFVRLDPIKLLAFTIFMCKLLGVK